MQQFVDFFEYKIFADKLQKTNILIRDKCIINTLNPHSFIAAQKDNLFCKALKESDILLPDGIGIVWAIKFLKGIKIRRITGPDIHQYLLNELNRNKGKVFYMGSSNNTLEKIKDKLKKEYPNIKSGFYSPPFKELFNDSDNEKIIKAINQFTPDVLFVGMTAPKQEKWAYLNKDKINANITCSIGAVFDFYAGTVKRSSSFWIKIGFEWVPRFFRQPLKLWKRVFISNPLFVLEVIKYKLIKNE